MNLRWLKSRSRRPIRKSTTYRKLRFVCLEDRINPATQLLPDLHVLSSYLSGWTVNTTSSGGKEIRYSTAMANSGQGAFDLRGTGTIITQPDGSQLQLVNQRVYMSDGSYVDQPAGNFTYHPTHGHIHFDDMAWGQLRIRTPGDGLGDVVAIGPKTSFCLIDINHFNSSLPGSPTSSVYTGCGTQVQGISVGWNDVYGSSLDGQSIDVTGIPNGNYWLEVVCDPVNHIQETNESNNVTRIPITLSTLPATGFRIQVSSPVGASQELVSSVSLTFNMPVDASTFTAADISFTGPNGAIPITGITAVSSVTYRVDFATQSAVGTYTMTIGANIANTTNGSLLDQNNNGTGGEPSDNYTNIFTIPAPRVSSVTPSGSTTPPVSSVRVTYSTAMQSASLTTEDIVSFTGPGGSNLLSQITSITPVTSGGSSAVFDINFSAQSTGGVYTLVLGPNVLDMQGHTIDQNGDGVTNDNDRYTSTFTIQVAGAIGPDGFGYNAVAAPYVNYSIVGLSGTVAIHNSADDNSLPFNLGTNSFNFYGTQYTGSNSLFVSTNGLVSFGSANSAYNNDNLSASTLGTIAPLWDDWVKGPGSPQVVGRLEDSNSDGSVDRLVIEWNNVYHYQTSPSGVTFQLILQLNTGAAPGAITFMYKDLDSGNASYNNGVNATIGIRAPGASGTKLIASYNASNPLIGSGKALRIAVPSVTSIVRDGKGQVNAGNEIQYTVTFSHDVTGVDIGDFAVTATGNHTGATVDRIQTTSAANVYELIVQSGVGNGTVRLDLVDNASIFSLAGAPLGGTGSFNGNFNRGEVTTIVQQPPKVQGINIGDGTQQRSRVKQVQVVFDRVVTFTSDPAAAFRMTRKDREVTLGVDFSLSTPEQTVARITFSGDLTSAGALIDGIYALRVNGALISTGGVALDGDNNGSAGGEGFFLLTSYFGDSDGDRDVDATDEAAFLSTYGLNSSQSGFLWYFDFNADGMINTLDRRPFYNRLGSTL